MLAIRNEEKHERRRENQKRTVASDIVRKSFAAKRSTPVTSLLEVGTINSDTSYELTYGSVPDTGDRFYTVKVAHRNPIRRVENWLMSGVFWTRHEAQSYIAYLRSRNGG